LLWYEDEDAAIGYAKWNSRVNGCRVEILDAAGKIVRLQDFLPGEFAY